MNKKYGTWCGALSVLMIIAMYSFLYVPMVVLVLFSFNASPFPAPWSVATLHWYRELWHASHLWQAFFHSLVIAIIAMMLSVCMSVSFLFYCMQHERVHWRARLFFMNLFVPEIVLAVGLLSFFTYITVPLGFMTLIIAHTVLGIGYTLPLLYVRFLAIDRSLIESSYDLGATQVQTFIRVIVPLLWPAIITSALLVFILSFDDFVLSYFCAGSTTPTLSLYILAMLRSGISPIINALSTILLLLSAILVSFFCVFNARSRTF